ncbi:putative oxidoreductase C-terminal domain-containing protein [Bacteroidota bacterium]
MKSIRIVLWLIIIIVSACNTNSTNKNSDNDMKFTGKKGEVKIITLDPGHFHAALVQKIMYDQVNPEVYVYAPEGPDITDHLNRINGFNNRLENPTSWNTKVYAGDDYLEKMLSDQTGNLMVTAGNNRKKTEYIKQTVEAGINVLADKPMVINSNNFELLKEAFRIAKQNGVLLYDIMTERHEITTILQKELSHMPDVFGELLKGSAENPSVTKESVHHFFKYVSGNKIKRPPWFFDVSQEGDGIVDVTTHLVDLIQWECFPEQIIDYHKDIKMISAKRWATKLTPTEFNTVTKLDKYPDYLKKDIYNDSILNVFSNGEMIYKIKNVYAKVSVTWNYEAPEGAGDTHFSIMRGTKAELVIKQGAEQNYEPYLYIIPSKSDDLNAYILKLEKAMQKINEKYPGVKLVKNDNSLYLDIPEKYKIGHEAHFAEVTKKYLQYLIDGKLPEWEVPNMVAKYYTTTQAFELSIQNM